MSTSVSLVERLFHEASALHGEARERFLSLSCGEDLELRHEVEALLALDEPPDARPGCPSHDSALLPPASASLLAGRSLGPYRLVRCLASGGMGSVYEAEQVEPRRTVAVEVLRADLAGEDLERRFLFEASFLARLQHPGIARVYEAGVATVDGLRLPWIAMELIEGARTITAHACEERLDLRARLALFAEVCDAVHHGHQRGVIHRDLKPANVLVDRAGRPKLIDFGIARAVDPARATYCTEAGVLLGTLRYMSPEQCVDARDLDVRSDVYSLGVMLYELVCGRLPHCLDGAALPELVRIVHEESPLRPSLVARELRGDLEAILLTALEPDRWRRYQSAAALAEDLRRYLRREAISVRAPGPVQRGALLVRRHKALAGSLAAVFLAALGTAVVGVRLVRRERSALAAEARTSYLASIAAADLSLRAHDAAGARRRLEGIPAERRGWEWRYLHGQLDLPEQLLGGRVDQHASAVCDLAFSPDGQRLATASFDRTVELIATDTWQVSATLAGHRDCVTAVAFHPGGERLASASDDGTVRLWDARTGAPLRTLEERDGGVRTLAFSPAGELLATGSRDGHVLLRSEDLALRASLAHEQAIAQLAFDPLGERLAVVVEDGGLVLWDVPRARELWRRSPLGRLHDVAFSPDGERLALASGDLDGTDLGVRLLDARTGEDLSFLTGHTDVVLSVAFTPDGERLASGSMDGTIRLWDPGSGEEALVLRGHESRITSMAFSPDGTLLATGGGSEDGAGVGVRVWRTEAGP